MADALLEDVVAMRSKPIEAGGRGIDEDVLRRRIQMDRESSRGYAQLSWPDVAKGCFYFGVPIVPMYMTVPSVTGGEAYLLPDSYILEHGKCRVVISANGVTSGELLLEQNQLIPASGALLVPLRLWAGGNQTFHRQRESMATVTLGEVFRHAAPREVDKKVAAKRGAERLITFNVQSLARNLGRTTENIRIVELPPQLFPRSRTDLAREQAKVLDLIATSRSVDDLATKLLETPTEELKSKLDAAAKDAEILHEDEPELARKKAIAAAKQEVAKESAYESLAVHPTANQGVMRPAAAAATQHDAPPFVDVQGVDIPADGRVFRSSLKGTPYWVPLPEFESAWSTTNDKARETTVKMVPTAPDDGQSMRDVFTALGTHFKDVNGIAPVKSDAAARRRRA